MTKAKMKKLVMLKWDYLAEFKYRNIHPYQIYEMMVRKYPELEDLKCNCAYCEEYYNVMYAGCPRCPVEVSGAVLCKQSLSLYELWWSNPCKKTARAMRDMLKKT